MVSEPCEDGPRVWLQCFYGSISSSALRRPEPRTAGPEAPPRADGQSRRPPNRQELAEALPAGEGGRFWRQVFASRIDERGFPLAFPLPRSPDRWTIARRAWIHQGCEAVAHPAVQWPEKAGGPEIERRWCICIAFRLCAEGLQAAGELVFSPSARCSRPCRAGARSLRGHHASDSPTRQKRFRHCLR